MIIYYMLFGGFLTASLVSLDRNEILGRQILLFVLLFSLLVLGLRYSVGNDFFSYERIFVGVDDFDNLSFFIYSLSESTPVESGFALLILIVKFFTDSYAAFVFVLAVLSIFLKYNIFNKLSPFIAVSFLLYFSDEWFWKDLSGARSALAATFILYGTYYAHARKLFIFLFFILLAILCHSASIVALPFYFVGYFASRIVMLSALLLSIVIGLAGGVGLLIVEFAGMLGFDESSRLIKYAESKYVGDGVFLRGTNLLHIFISLLFIYFYKPLVNKWSCNSIMIPLYVYGTVLMFLFSDYGIVWGRLREMLCIPAFVIVAPTFILLFKKEERLFPFLGILSYSLLFFILKMQDRAPYQSLLGLYG